MSKTESTNDVVLAESIFTPVMDVKQATKGFREFQKLKMELLDDTDIVMITVGNETKPFVKKSGWNKLALFFGASTRTVSSKKTHNPDGSYEWEVTVEAYKKSKEGIELFNVQRSALVSSLEKEKTEAMKNSARKSHDVFASAETRAEGRALAAFFGTGEVSAEEMGSDAQEERTDCRCAAKDTKISDNANENGEHMCLNCKKLINKVRYEALMKIKEPPTS